MSEAFLYVYDAKLSVPSFHTHLLAISSPCRLFSVMMTLHTILKRGNSMALTLLLISAVISVVSRRTVSALYFTRSSLFSRVDLSTSSTRVAEKCWPSPGSVRYVFSNCGMGLDFSDVLLLLFLASLCQARVATTSLKKLILGGRPFLSDFEELCSPLA